MAPKRNIVKSGNHGNSSKSKFLDKPQLQTSNLGQSHSGPSTLNSEQSKTRALFPPGSKYPLSLLNERCQKNDWGKPTVNVWEKPEGWSFSVTLRRINKKTSQEDTVQMTPHPSYFLPSALEARHWAATYALYRFCNGIQLNLVLPPGPRDYWAILDAERKAAPEHLQWMYEADPFEARRKVEERQARALTKKETELQGGTGRGKSNEIVPIELMNLAEVKMSTELRARVEEVLIPYMKTDLMNTKMSKMTLMTEIENSDLLSAQLQKFGFDTNQVQNAVLFLKSSGAYTSFNADSSKKMMDDALEFLLLHIPECDLPQRFLPNINNSNPFIVSLHEGQQNLQLRWLEDKAVKEAGWPSSAVKATISSFKGILTWGLLIEILNRKLIGASRDLLNDKEEAAQCNDFPRVVQEIDAVLSVYDNSKYSEAEHELIIPSRSGRMVIRIILSPSHPYPMSKRRPPVYITSNTVPAYIRLFCVKQTLEFLEQDLPPDVSEDLLFTIIEKIEEAWDIVQNEGPPDIHDVMVNLKSPREEVNEIRHRVTEIYEIADVPLRLNKRVSKARDGRSASQIKQDFDMVLTSKDYVAILRAREQLPAFRVRDEFLRLLQKNRVVVVVGETGCGKTTQLPQHILDHMISSSRGSSASIIVTQPRRISAVSVAAKVSAERLKDGSVGYAIRGENNITQKTKLLFCTTGVVLRRLSKGDQLQDVTHVMIDEVHERSVEVDLLLLQLRELLSQHDHLKIVLMSATINYTVFSDYFVNAPILHISGRTFPVADFYLEDIVPLLSYIPTRVKSTQSRSAKSSTENDNHDSLGLAPHDAFRLQTLLMAERIDLQLVAAVIELIMSKSEEGERKAILVFMPGMQDIRNCIKILKSRLQKYSTRIYPLHANLTSQEQLPVFQHGENWKIIVSTNIAETSITIDDVKYVIDTGRHKEVRYDPDIGLSSLVEDWINKAAAKQRRGRAGRTGPGLCYKLYTRKQEQTWKEYPIPEIQRVPLENVVLTVKAMQSNVDLKSYLRRALNPPSTEQLDMALSILEDLGAIDETGVMTSLGHHMSLLPIDVRLAKMLVLAALFRCLDPILTVVSCLSSKPLFFSNFDKREESNAAKLRFSSLQSDVLTDCHAFEQCTQLRAEMKLSADFRAFCDENFISESSLRDIDALRHEIHSALIDSGLLPPFCEPSDPTLNINKAHLNLIKSLICSGLWPQIARVKLSKSAIKFDKVQGGTILRDNQPRDFIIYDVLTKERVYLHPTSVLFTASKWKSPFIAYFRKQHNSKLYLREVTTVPVYAILLFGGTIGIDHSKNLLTVGGRSKGVQMRAWPRIGVLVNQIRSILDDRLRQAIKHGMSFGKSEKDPVFQVLFALLEEDGMNSAQG